MGVCSTERAEDGLQEGRVFLDGLADQLELRGLAKCGEIHISTALLASSRLLGCSLEQIIT